MSVELYQSLEGRGNARIDAKMVGRANLAQPTIFPTDHLTDHLIEAGVSRLPGPLPNTPIDRHRRHDEIVKRDRDHQG